MKKSQYSNIHYQSYLQLEKLLGSQDLRSVQVGEKAAHDEMLFIIVHQVYELWFKQMIHELTAVRQMFIGNNVDARRVGLAVERLDRVIKIQELTIAQIRIMETMTPLDFLEFRKFLFPASGFQSFQFRQMEVILGLRESDRMTYNGKPYTIVFPENMRDQLHDLEKNGSLFDLIEDWLERTPFLEFKGFSFIEEYEKAVTKMLDDERQVITESDIISDENKEMRLKMIGSSGEYFQNIFNPEIHEQLLAEGKLRMSYKATVAALLINLYRDEPILHLPYKLLMCLVDMDELFISWRYRHAQMVLRMLGKKVGTGGSSGHDYLRATAEKHHIYGDLHNISTLLIPRSELPDLPENVKRQLGYYFEEINK